MLSTPEEFKRLITNYEDLCCVTRQLSIDIQKSLIEYVLSLSEEEFVQLIPTSFSLCNVAVAFSKDCEQLIARSLSFVPKEIELSNQFFLEHWSIMNYELLLETAAKYDTYAKDLLTKIISLNPIKFNRFLEKHKKYNYSSEKTIQLAKGIVLECSKHELLKNYKVLLHAYNSKTKTNVFAKLPQKVLLTIASNTGIAKIHTTEQAVLMLTKNSCKKLN
jgi:hypothetical protein